MDHERRIDKFKGSDVAYIRYLETQLEGTRRHVSQLCQSLPRPQYPASPPDSFAGLLEGLSNDGSECTPWDTSFQTQGSVQGSIDVNVLDGTVPSCKDVREELKFIEYNVTKEKIRNEKPQWRSEIDKLLADVPVASRWVDKREELDLSDAQNHLALTVLLRRPWRVTSSPDDSCHSGSSTNGLLDCAKTYANATKDTQCLAKIATNLALFQELILVSLCVVLVEIGVSEDHVDPVMKLCWASEKKQEKEPDRKTLRRNRRGARWVNRCIGKLSESGWGLRSTEIFLLGGRSVNMYGRFSDFTQESFSLFTAELVDPTYTTPYQETPDWLPYNIPCIIKRLFGDALELCKICKILGYSEKAQALFEGLPLEYDRYVQSATHEHCFQRAANTHGKKRPLPYSPRDKKRQRPTRTDNGAKHTAKKASEKKRNQGTSAGQPRDPPADPQAPSPLTSALNTSEPPTQLPVSSGFTDGSGFDARSMMAMGFDVTSMMEMGFDMSLVMEPGLLSSSPDADPHLDKVQHVEGNGIALPAWTSTSPIVTSAF
ncbi:uncharacterized protein PAC_15940 [Phialocephala subalpina]|uniref:Uncharacterized protein n=1 Tax=Phialocephala subalpina TaxID=576137 RepID=A0A1L7XLX9_9HELO|nr:uncharacterized protein PAC_15940 [Phialocephala subalpina]